MNCGTSLLLFQGQLAFVGLYFLIGLMRKCCYEKAKFPQRLRSKIKATLFWNGFIDFFAGAQIEMQLASIIQLMHFNGDTSGDLYSISFAILVATILVLQPILSMIVLC